ncbi:nucleotidyltransferase family protein [Luteolibacter flavescens]|uniref:Nucleotidyltransferase family protein n=1 Tax=Luteolibacter flavescens TaxID=1859460 RepID=A0ABT3FJ82_9BACT|nr:nucleotidyltransferase family protein [Luteolibacter flavescens]MCW1883616.1 nucleotidyltransferase family protein [Luteolibacter flavescens]
MSPKRHLPEFAHSLSQRFESDGIPLLLAGGWAVCFHGYSRATLDIDWICKRSQIRKASELMESLGFERMTDGMACRFKHRRDPSVPYIDLIWVDDATFGTMRETSEASPLPLSVPMLGFRALLAMKLFALKDGETRDHKDLLDIRSLLRYSATKLDDSELKELCNRYAGPQAFDLIRGPQ